MGDHHAGDCPSDDVYLAKQIEQAVGADERTTELGITVEVAGQRVMLHGTVASERRKESVEAVVAEHAPGREIINNVEVVDPEKTWQDAGSAPLREETPR